MIKSRSCHLSETLQFFFLHACKSPCYIWPKFFWNFEKSRLRSNWWVTRLILLLVVFFPFELNFLLLQWFWVIWLRSFLLSRRLSWLNNLLDKLLEARLGEVAVQIGRYCWKIISREFGWENVAQKTSKHLSTLRKDVHCAEHQVVSKRTQHHFSWGCILAMVCAQFWMQNRSELTVELTSAERTQDED